MFDGLKQKLGGTRYVKKLVEEQPDLGVFRRRPSIRFSIGMGIIAFSYLMAWPFITLLGIISLIFRNPLIVAVGGPVAYVASHLVFFLGAWFAGKDSINYMKVFSRWVMLKICYKLSIIDQDDDTTEIPR